MAVHKRKRNGKTTWFFKYDVEGSSRGERQMIREYGFSTKQAAVDAETARRKADEEKASRAAAGGVAAPLPKTMADLLQEFMEQRGPRLAPKTRQRYTEQIKMLDPQLVKMPITEVHGLHLTREWNRLEASGGHKRGSKDPRPLSAKTCRNIAGIVSAAFNFCIKGSEGKIIAINPVVSSELPVPRKRKGIGLTVPQLDLLIEAARGPWCMGAILEVAAGLAVRRGELLALRWSDIHDCKATIGRSLSQTKSEGLVFKSVKGHERDEDFRVIVIPDETMAALEAHRQRQNEFRQQFIETYRADLDLVFCNPNGTPLRPDSISATVSAMFKKLKIAKPKGGALHLLRHSQASQMLGAGAPLTAVSARLGHSSIRTTAEIYSHVLDGQDRKVTSDWEEYRKLARAANPPVKAVH